MTEVLGAMHPYVLLDDIQAFLAAGGPVVRVLMVLALILWAMILERVFYYAFSLRTLTHEIRNQWEARTNTTAWYADKLKRRLIAQARRTIRGPLPMIRACVAICPLVGLLGTVTGMIQVFQIMAVLGTGNAREMASGVSAATLPTLAGMVLALSGMYPILRFSHIVERETRFLSDQLVVPEELLK